MNHSWTLSKKCKVQAVHSTCPASRYSLFRNTTLNPLWNRYMCFVDSLNCSPLVTLCRRFTIVPCIEVNYVITYTDVAGVALTVYRTELQMPQFDRSLISFLYLFIYLFLFYLFDQQSEYTAFHKLMCWQESRLGTFWRGEISSSEGVSYSWLQVSWPSSFQSPWNIVPWYCL
jgi:hypothetical protein